MAQCERTNVERGEGEIPRAQNQQNAFVCQASLSRTYIEASSRLRKNVFEEDFLKVQQKVDYEDRLEVAVVVVSFCFSCRLRCCSDLNEAFVMFLVQRICKIRLQSFSGFGGK